MCNQNMLATAANSPKGFIYQHLIDNFTLYKEEIEHVNFVIPVKSKMNSTLS